MVNVNCMELCGRFGSGNICVEICSAGSGVGVGGGPHFYKQKAGVLARLAEPAQKPQVKNHSCWRIDRTAGSLIENRLQKKPRRGQERAVQQEKTQKRNRAADSLSHQPSGLG